MTQRKTVFFTGGAGFIGLHVIPMLLERGYNVRIFDNMFRGDRDRVADLVLYGACRTYRPRRQVWRSRASSHEGLQVSHPLRGSQHQQKSS